MKLYKNKKSNIHRDGLSAATNIKKGQKIIQYKGKKVSLNKVETNSKYDNEKALEISAKAIESLGFTLGKEVSLGVDFASSTQWNDKSQKYIYDRAGFENDSGLWHQPNKRNSGRSALFKCYGFQHHCSARVPDRGATASKR